MPGKPTPTGFGLVVVSLLICSAAALLAGQTSATQTPQSPTFRTETNLIEVDAIATDRDGNPVRDLTKDDFVIIEDGKPQTVATFAFVDLPATRTEPMRLEGAVVEADVFSNDRPFEGQVYLLVLDDLETDPDFTRPVVDAARLFIEQHFGDRDLMMIAFTSGRQGAGRDFTSNRRLLVSTVDAFVGRRSLIGGATLKLERRAWATKMLRLLGDLSTWSNDAMPGRHKTLMLFSQGIDVAVSQDIAAFGNVGQPPKEAGFTDPDFEDIFGNGVGTSNREEVRRAIAAATAANVSIVTVDSRGLAVFGGLVADANRFGPGAVGTAAIGIGMDGHTSLEALAEETGGRAVLRTNNLDGAFGRIVRERASYYALAYSAPSTNKPGTFHKISVKLNRTGVEIRARGGYVMPAARQSGKPGAPALSSASAELNAALSSPLASQDMAISAFATPFKGPGKLASVLVGAELRNLPLGPPDQDGRLHATIDLAVIVTDLSRISGGKTDRLQLVVGAERAAADRGVRVLHRFDLAPGKYQLRIAARDVASGRTGSMIHDIEVPDFGTAKVPLAVSGLILSAPGADVLATTGDKDPLMASFAGAPSASRRFSPAEDVQLFAEIYQDAKSSQDITLETRLFDDAGRAVSETSEIIPSDHFRQTRGAYELRRTIPLAGLTGGGYVLRVTVRSQGSTTSRQVPFTVTVP